MQYKLWLILFFVCQLNHLYSQNDHSHEGHHDHHGNEIGIANALVYFVNEKETAYGIHIHYIYNLPHSRFGLGLGYERIFDEHKHNTFGIVGSFRPIEPLTISMSPGITFEDTDQSNAAFALHLEGTYEFEIADFHFGPSIELAYDPEDYHISIGIHIGYGF